MMNEAPKQLDLERFIAGRWKEFDGEVRATLLRLILIVVFYSIQLVHYLSLTEWSDADKIFHRQVTLVAAGWLFVSLAVFISLKGGFMPAALKYITTRLCDSEFGSYGSRPQWLQLGMKVWLLRSTAVGSMLSTRHPFSIKRLLCALWFHPAQCWIK
jgi:hypothetical protein